MARKTNTKQVIDGKVDQPVNLGVKEKRQVKSIDELLGRAHPAYAMGTPEEYEVKIKNMATSDLERHATEVGIMPRTERNTLITRLVAHYRKTASSYFGTVQMNTIQPKNVDKALAALKGGKS